MPIGFMRSIRRRRFFFYIGLSSIAILLVACSVPGDGSNTLPPPDPSSATDTAAPSGPTDAPPLALFVAGPGSDAGRAAEIETLLGVLANEAGVTVERRESLAAENLPENVRLVVALPPDPGIAGLAAAAPNTQFVAVGISGVEAVGNVSSVGGGGGQTAQLGFIAGYLAAIVTDDWRVGVINVADTAEGQSARQGFLAGVEYFCGLCTPYFPPFLGYPLYAESAATAGPEEWQASAGLLIQNAVDTVYIAPGAGDASLAVYLANAGVQIIGSGAPPPEAARQWLASVERDALAGLDEVLRKALAGEASGQAPAPFTLTHVNPERLSEGRRLHVEAIIPELQAGVIGITQ